MLATRFLDCVGALLGGVRRVADEATRPGHGPDQHPPPATPEQPETAFETDERDQLVPGQPGAGVARTWTRSAVPTPAATGADLPPAPWRWQRVWPTPGRPAGMALIASDGTLVLWSAGGFAAAGAASDGRPSEPVAAAIADLPELERAASEIEGLRSELQRARAVTARTRRLLIRSADAVDDQIEGIRRHEVDDRSDPAPT